MKIEMVECSTPFGIKDSCGAADHAEQVRLVDVLNAFRHQRFLRQATGATDGEPFDGCSTPFGIKDSCGVTGWQTEDESR